MYMIKSIVYESKCNHTLRYVKMFKKEANFVSKNNLEKIIKYIQTKF